MVSYEFPSSSRSLCFYLSVVNISQVYPRQPCQDKAMNYILISPTSIEVKVSLGIRPETELRIFTSLQGVVFIN